MASAHDAVITQQDIEVFTDGDCHILARELYEHTGWPMCVFGPCADGREHVFVMTPTGHALDVKGIHTLEALKKEWGFQEFRETSWEGLMDCGWDESVEEEAPQLAAELAPHIIAEAEGSLQMRAGAVSLAALLPCG